MDFRCVSCDRRLSLEWRGPEPPQDYCCGRRYTHEKRELPWMVIEVDVGPPGTGPTFYGERRRK